jgi:low temperature requirement protein LtrA
MNEAAPGEAAGVDEGPASRVSPLELFFDLVMVFAITQITGLVVHDHDAQGVLRGVLLFAALWWAWGAYAWLTNTVRVDDVRVRLVLLGGMAATLVAALAVPGSFEDDGVAFGLAYLAVMALHLALFSLAASDRETSRQAILRLAPTNLGAGVLLVVGGALHGGGQEALWALAVVVIFVGPYVTGVGGFSVHPSHFAERHGLIVIVALGESVIAIGAGGEVSVEPTLAATALAAIALVIGLWWAYFDHDAERNEAALTAATGPARATLARDTYSYLHVPLVLGIVLAAVGIHDALAHPDEKLDPLIGGLLAAGVALYFLGLVAMRARCGAAPGRWYPAAVAGSVAVGLLAPHVPAAASLVLLAAVALGSATVDGWRGDGTRTDARSEPVAGPA